MNPRDFFKVTLKVYLVGFIFNQYWQRVAKVSLDIEIHQASEMLEEVMELVVQVDLREAEPTKKS